MRDAMRAYAVTLALGFRAAPVHATCQLLTGVAMALAMPIGAYGGKLLVDAAVDNDLRRGLIAGGLLALTAALVLVVIFYYVHCLFGVFERANAEASLRLMRLMGGTHGLAHHERPDYLDQVHRIRERRQDLAAAVNATVGVLRAVVTLAATAALLARVQPVLLLLPVFAVLSVWLGNRSRNLDIAAQEATSEPDRLRRHLFELGTAATAGKELRVFGLGGVLLDRHHRAAERVLRARNRASWRGAMLQSLDGLVAGLVYAGAITVVLVMAIDGRATPGDVILVIGLASQLSLTVLSGVVYLTALLRVVTLAKRFVWLEDYARGAQRSVAAPVAVPARLTEGIALREVSFAYPDTERPVLDRVSLRLPAGAVVALVGENGAGKTTLIKLLCDFYRRELRVPGAGDGRGGGPGPHRRPGGGGGGAGAGRRHRRARAAAAGARDPAGRPVGRWRGPLRWPVAEASTRPRPAAGGAAAGGLRRADRRARCPDRARAVRAVRGRGPGPAAGTARSRCWCRTGSRLSGWRT